MTLYAGVLKKACRENFCNQNYKILAIFTIKSVVILMKMSIPHDYNFYYKIFRLAKK